MDSSFAEHLAKQLDPHSGRWILGTPQEIIAFSGLDSRRQQPLEMLVLENRGDLHFFREHKPGELNQGNLLGTFYKASETAELLKYPITQAVEGAYPLALDFVLHDNAIELYFMGGTKDLKREQKEARGAIKGMAEVLYQKAHRNLKLEVKEEKTIFKTNKNGAYESGYLKTVVRPVKYDLPLNVLGW